MIGSYTGYAVSTDTNPWGISSSIDKIFEQTSLTLDAAGNVLQSAFFQLNQGVTGATGVLTPGSGNARVIYSGIWFDGIGRTIATANYGINTFEPSEVFSPPASSATVLVSQTLYNARGEAYYHDRPGRQRSAHRQRRRRPHDPDHQQLCSARPMHRLRRDRTLQLPAPWPLLRQGTWREACPQAGNDQNVMVATCLHARRQRDLAHRDQSRDRSDQTTRYLYGTTLEAVPGTVGGNAIARSDLLVAVLYPDASDSTDFVQFAYNLQSQVNWTQDQNGSVHQYLFDGLGRRTSDQVTTLGTNVDGTVQRIDTGYEIRGMVNLVTSYANPAGTSIVNQVTLTFDLFEQLMSDQQHQSGFGGPVLTVNYAYQAITSTSNAVPRTAVQYPYGADSRERDVQLQFRRRRGPQPRLVHPSSAATLWQAELLWAMSIAETDYDSGSDRKPVARGCDYPGLDLFGRIVNLPWVQGSTSLVQLNYGYDQASNRIYRQDVQAENASALFDEIYGYDGLHRLTAAAQGKLTSGVPPITNPTLQQAWHLDATGNWTELQQLRSTHGLE